MEMKNEKALIGSIRKRLSVFTDQEKYLLLEDVEIELDGSPGFEGLTVSEVGDLEKDLGVRFPILFKEYLLELGKNPGYLFCGSDIDPIHFKEYRSDAEKLIKESGIDSFLSDQSVVFIFHQGYTFCYFESQPVFDTAVYQYTEGDKQPIKVSDSFYHFLDSELKLMERK